MPKKGDAVLWYNHVILPDGTLGDRDLYSVHMGMAVDRGIKRARAVHLHRLQL